MEPLEIGREARAIQQDMLALNNLDQDAIDKLAGSLARLAELIDYLAEHVNTK